MTNILHSAPAMADARGVQIVYDTFGDPASAPFLLIMGLSWQMIMWDDQFCSRLAAKDYFVIRFDNRDCGQSTKFSSAGTINIVQLVTDLAANKPVKVPYHLSDMARDCVGLLDHLEIEAAHVAGVSMGGMIAQVMALKYPARVRTLTSIMSTTGDPSLPPPTPAALSVLMTPPPTDREGFTDAFLRYWQVLNGNTFAVDRERVSTYAQITFERGLCPEGVSRQMAAVSAAGSRRQALAGLSVPLLVIHGREDPLLPLACGIDTAKAVPGAKLEIIPGMGHTLPSEVWPQVIAAIVGHARQA